MVFFGATMAADNLGGNMYRDFILLTLVRFPADLLAIVLGNRYVLLKETLDCVLLWVPEPKNGTQGNGVPPNL